MCIAIFKPKDQILDKDTLQHCFEQNPHGAGFAYPDFEVQRVVIKKGIFDFEEFWTQFVPLNRTDIPCVVHFRVATSGNVNGENCHPWRIDGRIAMIHNGNLAKIIGVEHPEFSDTGLYVANILKPMIQQSRKIWKSNAFKWMVEEYFGPNNKMVILNHRGDHVIFNEGKGEWHKGSWYSNKTFEDARKKTYTSYNCAVTTTYYGTGVKFEGEVVSPKVNMGDIIHKEPPADFVLNKKEPISTATAPHTAYTPSSNRENINSVPPDYDVTPEAWFELRGINPSDYI